MIFPDEKLSAYLDGELSSDEMAKLRLALEKDPALSRRIKTLKQPDELIIAAYSDINTKPVPEPVMNLLQPESPTIQTSVAGDNISHFPFHHLTKVAGQWTTPLAASLALAIGIGVGMQSAQHANTPIENAMLFAGVIDQTQPIHQVLESGRSAETVFLDDGQTASTTPVLTFKSTSGDYCREFILVANNFNNRAVACRGNEGWTIQFAAIGIVENIERGSYSTALPGVNAAFNTMVDELIDDVPLDAPTESALIQRQWRD
ncbi:MAG: hypothetical protein JKX88_07810 [Marinicaulis sp.]|nr:hypothetical protein [Marinicaulis sp.]